jgi:two-component system, LytTR family, sensor kinase
VEAVLLAVALAVTLLVPGCVLWRAFRARRAFGTATERATYDVLHRANQAVPPFRAGLTRHTAPRAVKHLRILLGTPAVALTDSREVLAWEGPGQDHHADVALNLAIQVFATGARQLGVPSQVLCGEPDCPLRSAVAVPITSGDEVVGALIAFGSTTGAGLIRASDEVARLVSTQVELGEYDQSRVRLAEAEVRALRAQISPHFIYNSLTAIASFVRSDPEWARRLLLEFADFTRYSFRRHGQFTTLAEELRNVDKYLMLERARFGDRIRVSVQVAPEVLPVVVPFLVLQPLVENAVRHGLEAKAGPGHISIVAEDVGNEAVITVEDDGVGADPQQLAAHLAGQREGGGVGLANVDERLRTVFGHEYGLVVDTGVGAGTRVCLRVPKFRTGVRAS